MHAIMVTTGKRSNSSLVRSTREKLFTAVEIVVHLFECATYSSRMTGFGSISYVVSHPGGCYFSQKMMSYNSFDYVPHHNKQT